MSGRGARALSALEGLEGRQHVGWVVGQSTPFADLVARCLLEGAEAGDRLMMFGPQAWPRRSLPLGQGVEVLDPRLTYLAGGSDGWGSMMDHLRRQAGMATAEGYRALRVVSDMDWLVDAGFTGARLIELEHGLDEVAADSSAIIVCAYRWESFAGTDLAGAMCVHPRQLGRSPEDVGFRLWEAEALPAAARDRDVLWLGCTRLWFVNAAGIRAIARVARSTGVRLTLVGAGDLMRTCWKLLESETFAANVEFLP